MKRFRSIALRASVVALVLAPVAQAQTPAPAPGGVQIAGPVLMVGDLERSLKFYINGLGLTLARRLPGNPGPGATLTTGADAVSPFLLIRQAGRAPVEKADVQIGNGLSRIMLTVADSDAAAARLRAAGFAPTAMNARKIFFVRDVDGYNYEVMQRGVAH